MGIQTFTIQWFGGSWVTSREGGACWGIRKGTVGQYHALQTYILGMQFYWEVLSEKYIIIFFNCLFFIPSNKKYEYIYYFRIACDFSHFVTFTHSRWSSLWFCRSRVFRLKIKSRLCRKMLNLDILYEVYLLLLIGFEINFFSTWEIWWGS